MSMAVNLSEAHSSVSRVIRCDLKGNHGPNLPTIHFINFRNRVIGHHGCGLVIHVTGHVGRCSPINL